MDQNNSTPGSNESTSHTMLSSDCVCLLNTLGNSSSRAILREAANEARTVDELFDACDISRTTIYRRINELIELGLLEESMRFTEGNQQCREFQTTDSQIMLRVDSDGFNAQIGSERTEPFTEGILLDESSDQQFQIALSGRDLRCRIVADGKDNSDNVDISE